jgi:hypothetical protein
MSASSSCVARARLRAAAALALLAALGGAPQAGRADVYVGLLPSTMTVSPGDTFTVTMAIADPDSSFNAFDASIRFDPARLEFVPTSPVSSQRGALMTSACSNTFHHFDTAPDSLKITLSLLCSGVYVAGPGNLYQVRFRALSGLGTTTISLGPFTEFYKAGLFVRPLHVTTMIVTVSGPTGVAPGPAPGGSLRLAPVVPNPRRGSSSLRLEFDVPSADRVSFDVLDLQGRRLAERPAQSFGAGRHSVTWAPPTLANGDYFVRLRSAANGSVIQRWASLR